MTHALKKKVKGMIKNPEKSLLILTFPVLLGMIVQVLYNIVDTAFVGRLGGESLAALTFVFPLFFIMVSLNSGIGMGLSSVASRLVGSHKKEEAENSILNGMFISLVFSIFMIIILLPFLDKIIALLGAEGNVVQLASSYLGIVLLGTPFMFMTFALATSLSVQGDTKNPTIIQIIGLLTNIILDYVFIFILGMGVKGAAIATVIAFITSFIAAMFIVAKKSHLRINVRDFRFSPDLIKRIILVGFPASVGLMIYSIYSLIANKVIAKFGVDSVASFGVISRIDSFTVMPLVALAATMTMLVGIYYGAKRYDLIKKIVSYSMKLGFIFCIFTGIVMFIFPDFFMRIFTAEQNIISIGAAYLLINVFVYPFMPFIMLSVRSLQGLGKPLPGLIINVIRIFGITLPMALILVYGFGLGMRSFVFSMVIGSAISALIAYIWVKKVFATMHIGDHQ